MSSSLCWSADGYSLLSNTVSTGVSTLPHFVRYSVLHALLPQSVTDDCSRLLLLGADRLLLSKRADSGLSQTWAASPAARRSQAACPTRRRIELITAANQQ